MKQALFLVLAVLITTTTHAQFRRGLFAESTEVTLYPVAPPAVLLPGGGIVVETRNTSTASARIVERLNDLMKRQIADNDARLRPVDKDADIIVTATLTAWAENRRRSTKYVSEQRQVGTREVTDKNGKKKTEPVYEYGHNEPSVVISANAAIRIEVKRRAGGAALADETARYSIQEEHLVKAGPPTRDVIEDQLIDNVVRRAAGRISPGREPVRTLLARADDVDRLNSFAQNRRWQDWLGALEDVKPNRDRKRDAYRLHNLAVAHEAIAYEATDIKESLSRLAKAAGLIQQAADQHKDEKYITESALRISNSSVAYQRLADMYVEAGIDSTPTPLAAGAPQEPTSTPPEAAASQSPAPTAMTNKDVIELRMAGLDDDNLIATIKEAKAVKFDLSPAGLKTLLDAKVSNRVIAAMRTR